MKYDSQWKGQNIPILNWLHLPEKMKWLLQVVMNKVSFLNENFEHFEFSPVIYKDEI